ncbi:MAG: right-handed parallel beta-helix repeat-containing protein [Clostridia bacterium]|nr:right-handed parallel beta-helix repeat-containing protein [Clostridia bacterium]
MKGRKYGFIPIAIIGVITATVFAITSAACSGISVWQLADASEVNSYGATPLNGAINYEYVPVAGDAYVIYVSPDGDNANDGRTRETAVSSIKQAQVLTRAYVAGGGNGDCVITLADGEYFLSGEMNIAYADVANGNRLFIRAENSGKATVSGSRRVNKSDIEEVSDEKLGRVWKIPCADSVNQLYVGDDYAIRARYPDSGEYLRLLNWDDAPKKIIIDSKDIEGFAAEDFEGSTFVAQIMWAESYLRIDGIQNKGDVSHVAVKSEDLGVFGRSSPQNKERQSYHFENSKAFLSVAGEFFYDGDESVIYYLPYPSQTVENTTVRIPYTEGLLSLKGSGGLYPVSNVYIEGLNFKYTGNAHIDGKIGNQVNKDDGSNKRDPGTLNDGRPYSAISLEYAENITFAGNTFAVMGGGAIDFVEGTQNITVSKNMFRSVGGNGILGGAIHYEIGMVKTGEATLVKDVRIENNYFTDIAWQEYGGCAVALNYCLNGVISHNTINNTRYTGISVGWGWSEDAYPFLANNKISYNYISGAINLLSDGSAIYLVGCQPDSEVFENYIENIYDSVWKFPNDVLEHEHAKWALSAIYLDQGVGGTDADDKVRVYDNCIYGGDVQHYFTDNAKSGHFEISEISSRKKSKVKKAAGADRATFENVYSQKKIFGFYMDSETKATVFGEALDSKDSVLVLRGKDGNFTQLYANDVISWDGDKIEFLTENYSSGEAFLLNKDGTTSYRLFLTLNTDRFYSQRGRFNEEWGDFSGLARLRTLRLDLRQGGFKASSTLPGWSPRDIDDNNTYTGWSSGPGDTNPWISFELDGMSTIDKFIVYARTGNADQPECRRNFEIHGYDENGADILLFSVSGDDEAYPPFGSLVIDVSGTEYKDTVFQGFKICRPEGNSDYFFIAEVAIL